MRLLTLFAASLVTSSMVASSVGAHGKEGNDNSEAAVAARDRLACIASTHPQFDDTGANCDAWTCVPGNVPGAPDTPCCMEAMGREEALALLNGTVVQVRCCR